MALFFADKAQGNPFTLESVERFIREAKRNTPIDSYGNAEMIYDTILKQDVEGKRVLVVGTQVL